MIARLNYNDETNKTHVFAGIEPTRFSFVN